MYQANTTTATYDYRGIWGPVTATLDWCEANYQFSRYIAEMANSVSNAVSLALALYGLHFVCSQGLPPRYIVGFVSLAVVSLGSMAFHATLRYSAQMADELPMILTVSCNIFIVFDKVPGFKLQPLSLLSLYGIIAFDLFFTWSYWVYRNPVYHQVVFGCMMVLNAAQIIPLIRPASSPATSNLDAETKSRLSRLYWSGTGYFLLGFFIWNMDNVFCNALTGLKKQVGWPVAFLLEGHSWWHVFTGIGSYLMWVGTTYLSLCIKDDPKKYTVVYDLGFVPRVQLQQIKA